MAKRGSGKRAIQPAARKAQMKLFDEVAAAARPAPPQERHPRRGPETEPVTGKKDARRIRDLIGEWQTRNLPVPRPETVGR